MPKKPVIVKEPKKGDRTFGVYQPLKEVPTRVHRPKQEQQLPSLVSSKEKTKSLTKEKHGLDRNEKLKD